LQADDQVRCNPTEAKVKKDVSAIHANADNGKLCQ
jgi:hypothetical protein